MILLNKLIKKINFNNIIVSSFLTLIMIFSYSFTSFSKTNYNNSLNKYLLQLTYYYSGDSTGSGSVTGSGLKTSDFKADSNGWYHYQNNGEDYLVVAAATTYCRDSSNHCGVDIKKHGMALNIPYYNYYDVISLNIGGTDYKAIVVDSCGACMWGDRDTMGEKIDIYTVGPSAVNPSIYQSSSSGSSGSSNINLNGISDFTTTYEGDIKSGYLYKRQSNNSLKVNENFSNEKIDERLNIVINNIFNVAKAYSDGTNALGNYDLVAGSTEASDWKQYDSAWGKINLGNSKETIKSAGCLVTSVAIQIKISGTQINSENFNPGTFVNLLNKNKAFNSQGMFKWTGWNEIAPNWIYEGKDVLPGSKSEKIGMIRLLLSQGYYPVMCVKRNCGHWVAVTGVTDDNISIYDPGSSSTTVWPKYKGIENDKSLKVAKFKKTD